MIQKEYTNGEVTIVWKPELCTHSAFCARGLPAVFQPKVKPWITATAASTEAIIEQVKKCPSGALSFYMNNKTNGMENDNLRMNEERRRFELDAEGQTAIINYSVQGDTISLLHTEVPERLQGKGIGNKIVSATLNYIKDHNFKVAPLCSFVEAYIARHKEWDSIVTNGY